MMKSKSLLAVLSGMLAAFTLGGCLTNGEPNGGGASFSFTTEIDVLNIIPPQASAPGTITTRSIEGYCEDDVLVKDTLIDTSKYVISGGKLYLWSQGDCFAAAMSGSSSSIIGTWTSTSMEAEDSVPAAFRPQTCDPWELDGNSDMFEDVSVEYKVSSTKINGKAAGKVCFARASAEDYEVEQPGVQAVAEDCTTLKLRNPSNEIATITTGFKDDSVTIKFTYGKKTCAGSLYLGLSNALPTCPEDDNSGASYVAFSECVSQSGFYEDIDLEKQAALAKKTFEALRSGARGPF